MVPDKGQSEDIILVSFFQTPKKRYNCDILSYNCYILRYNCDILSYNCDILRYNCDIKQEKPITELKITAEQSTQTTFFFGQIAYIVQVKFIRQDIPFRKNLTK